METIFTRRDVEIHKSAFKMFAVTVFLVNLNILFHSSSSIYNAIEKLGQLYDGDFCISQLRIRHCIELTKLINKPDYPST